jgi:hypothetical protein
MRHDGGGPCRDAQEVLTSFSPRAASSCRVSADRRFRVLPLSAIRGIPQMWYPADFSLTEQGTPVDQHPKFLSPFSSAIGVRDSLPVSNSTEQSVSFAGAFADSALEERRRQWTARGNRVKRVLWPMSRSFRWLWVTPTGRGPSPTTAPGYSCPASARAWSRSRRWFRRRASPLNINRCRISSARRHDRTRPC